MLIPPDKTLDEPGRGLTTHEWARRPGSVSETGLISRQVAVMAAAWERGEQMTAAEILERFPDLDSESAIQLIYEEFCLRREAGLEVDRSEVVRRYPRWKDELRALFDCDRLIAPGGAVAGFPEVGETLGPFRLLAELGRGASGRTFLAADPGLADRLVVVKVVPADQEEHLALARLRHTHIVPLFSEHTFPERCLRVLCMPYLGGASLAQILKDLVEIPVGQRSGKLLVETIDRNTRTASTPFEAPFRRSLEHSSYVHAITWIGACLADALHYAHARGAIHMDVKPSNVLITVDGQPMLLDFHLTRGPIQAGDWVADRVGGTPGWMSPEQRAAMDAVEDCQPVTTAVDGRTDIYALGLLIREALGASDSSRKRRDVRPAANGQTGISVGLADILRKCTAETPSDRYHDAATLAEDLRRQLNDLPLRGVRNRSPIERWRKWRRRHPGALGWGVAGLSIVFAVAIALIVSLAAVREHDGQLRADLADGRNLRASGQFDEAIRTLKRGLETAKNAPAAGELTQAIHDEISLAQRGRMANELHNLADQIRFRHGIELPSDEDARALLQHCRTIWDQRDRLLLNGGAFGRDTEQRVKSDLLELAVVWADLRVRLALPKDRDEAKRDALSVLDQSDASYGPSLAIDLRRAALGRTTTAATTASSPRTAWEHYDLGRYHLRLGHLEAAAAEFRTTLSLRPQDFWSNFYQGLCAFHLRDFEDAVAAFRTCIALVPQSAICRYNRALAHEALGRTDLAYDDYTAAVDLDPKFAAAFLNRGILSYKRGHHSDAVADFEQALSSDPDGETLGRIHDNLALVERARGERSTARGSAETSARGGCPQANPLVDGLP
jgi:serine/threonine protein kinase/Flp pilus assembly protein TadD